MKWFLLSVSFLFTLFSTILPAMEPPADVTLKRLRQAKNNVEKSITHHPLQVFDANKVLLIGNTGSGKSTLFHFLTGIDLQANNGKLYPNRVLPGAKIGDSVESQTDLPTFQKLYDGTILCDLAGFKDTKGPISDVIHRYSYHQLLQKNAKILLVVSETSLFDKANDFRSLIESVVAILPVDELINSAALVVSKQGILRNFNSYVVLSELSRSPSLSVDAKKLLAYWISETERDAKILYFPYPLSDGSYDGDVYRTIITQALAKLKPMSNPKLGSSLPPECVQKIAEIANSIFIDLSVKLAEFSNKIISRINEALVISDDPEMVICQLKEILAPLQKALENTLHSNNHQALNFIDPLIANFFYYGEDHTSLLAFREDLLFLSKLSEISFPRHIWARVLNPLIDLLNKNIAAQMEMINTMRMNERLEWEREQALQLAEAYRIGSENQQEHAENADQNANFELDDPAPILLHVVKLNNSAPDRINEAEYQKRKREGLHPKVKVFYAGGQKVRHYYK